MLHPPFAFVFVQLRKEQMSRLSWVRHDEAGTTCVVPGRLLLGAVKQDSLAATLYQGRWIGPFAECLQASDATRTAAGPLAHAKLVLWYCRAGLDWSTLVEQHFPENQVSLVPIYLNQTKVTLLLFTKRPDGR
ncbi:hypothetical protein HMN09_01070000 [Mycena chlorophos]|uniref:Uncharacterized protein n=1 Tax=Mycena chlorophos TaxID=658473 RepID=A0A8H6SCW7_MYCCL|nr:hypothetical protein HMN09_01070000 [Mycena chlorophos]